MRTTEQFSITLPNKMASRVRERVASGEYASESEVIREGLRALEERDGAVERWLKTEVVAAYDKMREDTNRARTTDQVREALAEVRKRRAAGV